MTNGLYFRSKDNLLIEWEGPIQHYNFGIVWAGAFSGKIAGTPMSREDFRDKILNKGFEYIGPVGLEG